MTRKISRREALIGVSAVVASTGMVELALGASGKSITIRVKDIERLEGMRGKELLNVRLPDRRRRSGWHAAACEAYRQTPTAELLLHQGPRNGSYLSAVVARLTTASDLGVLRIRGNENTPGLLGVRLNNSEWQLTLQFATGVEPPSWDAALESLAAVQHLPNDLLEANHDLRS